MHFPPEAGTGPRGRVPAESRGAADDRDATARLVSAYLPLAYNIVGRALNGHPALDGVVRETVISAVSGVRDPRDEAAFRAMLLAACVRQIRGASRLGATRPPRVP